jgi:hypothetical protein
MLLHYRLDLTRDAADQIVYEESANYGDAFTCFVIGVFLLVLATAGILFDTDNLSRRKLLANSFFGGFCFCCFSLSYLIKSTVILDREQQTLTIRRRILGIAWTHRYPVDEIEEIFESTGAREGHKRLLGIEFRNGRTKRLTLWAKLSSLSAEEAHLNEALKRAWRHSARQTGRVHKHLTEEAWWAHTKDNARLDMRRHLRRALYALIVFIATAAAVVPFLYGYPLHPYWTRVGTILLFISMGLWLLLILEAVLSYIDWQYMRDLEKIDRE